MGSRWRRWRKGLLFALATGALAIAASAGEPLETDWAAFVRVLSATISRDDAYAYKVNQVFSGKEVTCEGAVSGIQRPARPGGPGQVRMAMDVQEVRVRNPYGIVVTAGVRQGTRGKHARQRRGDSHRESSQRELRHSPCKVDSGEIYGTH